MSPKQHTPLNNLRREETVRRWERRKMMVTKYEQGYSFTDFADAIAKEFKVTVTALKRDWARRKEWLPILAQVDDKKFRISQVAMRIRAIMDVCWETYRAARKANNHNACVGAIEKLIRVSQHEVDIFQSLGVLEKEPTKIDAFITTPGTMPFEELPEVKEARERIAERLRAEKDANQP